MNAHTIDALSGKITEQLRHATDGQCLLFVIDATGNHKQSTKELFIMARRPVYTDQRVTRIGDVLFTSNFTKRSHPAKRPECATRENFMQVINAIQQEIVLEKYITHRIPFNDLKDGFDSLTAPNVILSKPW